MSIKVSICIPTFNQTEFLKKNLESILSQSFKNYEIIISDDSTDNRVQALVENTLKNSGVQYIYHHNKQSLGSPANWNKAIELSSGEYIKIMHHDDWFSDSESLNVFVQSLDQHPQCDLVFCNSSILNVSTQTYSINQPDANFLNELQKNSFSLFNNNQIGAPSATIYRSKLKMKFDEKMSYLVDVDFYIRLLQTNHQFFHINNALIVNTSHHAEQVTAKSINKITQVGEYCFLYHKLMPNKFPEKKYRIFFRDLFAWYKLDSFQEIENKGYPIPSPNFIFKLLLLHAKLFK